MTSKHYNTYKKYTIVEEHICYDSNVNKCKKFLNVKHWCSMYKNLNLNTINSKNVIEFVGN